MRIAECRVYRGPHLYSHTPMVRVQVDLGELEHWPTDRIEGFAGRLVAELPGLQKHGCCYGEPGGFLRRLADGTWLGHVTEHVALELQTLAGAPVTRGKTRSVKGSPGVYNVMFAYQDEAVGRLAGRIAFELVDFLLPPHLKGFEGLDLIADGEAGPFDLAQRVESLRRLVEKRALGPTTRALFDAARARRIPVERLNDMSLLRMGWGSRQKKVQASITSDTSFLAVEAAGNKAMAKQLLSRAGLPVPRGAVVRSAEEAVLEAARIRGPVVTKPLDGNHGRGVSVGLANADQVAAGFAAAVSHSRRVIVEELFTGRDYRVLVIGGKMVAAAERRPAQVVGDGRRTIAQLLDSLNADPRRGEGHEKVMTRVKTCAALDALLADQGLAMDSIPSSRRVVRLSATANLSTGGSALDCTDKVHPENRAICEKAASVIGLDVCGIDFICPDIGRPVRQTGGGIIEVNAAPGFRMHLQPSEGQPRDVAGPVIDALYPRGSNARIPVIAITGTNGKSTTVRMVAHMLRLQGLNVGYTSTSGIYRNGELVMEADASGPKSARLVLSDPTVDAAVLETARGGILREGLGFDRCDIGAVLNVTPDHLGVGSVQDLHDLAAVKSVVTESVSRRGWSVLNADDPLTLRMARHAGGQVAWFSMKPESELSGGLLKHIAEGGVMVGLEGDGSQRHIVIRKGPEVQPVCAVHEIPATLDGAAEFNVANALAATAIGFGHGLSPYAIAQALRTFSSDFAHNPGRLNIHDGHGFRVILDYAHNPAALRALGDMIRRLRPSYGRVIGCASMPGDRRDEDLREMGAISAEIFDHVVFRERPDGRGRAPGEVLRLMSEGAVAAGCPPDRMDAVLGEAEAMEACLRMAAPGDLVVLLPTKVEAVWRQILAFRPSAAAGPAGESAHV